MTDLKGSWLQSGHTQARLKQKQSVTSRHQEPPKPGPESSDRLSPEPAPPILLRRPCPPDPHLETTADPSQSRLFCECVGVSSDPPPTVSPASLAKTHTPSHVHHPGRPSLVWKLWSSAAPEKADLPVTLPGVSCNSHFAGSVEQVKRRAIFQTRIFNRETLSMENSLL